MSESEAREAAVRDAFRAQARWCAQLGSPFTSALCACLAERLDGATPLGARMLAWPGNPDALHDSLPLRIAGGLHALVRRGHLPGLAALYPPNPLPEPDRLWPALADALRDPEGELAAWLGSAPQTNEVARSAVLISGYCVVAAETGLPLSLMELGASAGLNLLADRYRCRLGTREVGPPDSPVRLAPGWTGGDPPEADLRIASRRGIDLNPLDAGNPADRERLVAYVWADQQERLARIEAALGIAAQDPPRVEKGDAAEWLEARLGEEAPGVARVVAHSIAFQYFPPETRSRITATMEAAGARASAAAPLGWLRYEVDHAFDRPSLRLRLWPGGTDRVLALADAHARKVEWRG